MSERSIVGEEVAAEEVEAEEVAAEEEEVVGEEAAGSVAIGDIADVALLSVRNFDPWAKQLIFLLFLDII